MSLLKDRPPDHEPPSPGLALLVCDEQGDLLVSNGAADRLLGRTDGTTVEPDDDAEGENNAGRVDSFLRSLLEGEEPTSRERIAIRDPRTGARLHAPALGLRIVGRDDDVLGAVAVLALGAAPESARETSGPDPPSPAAHAPDGPGAGDVDESTSDPDKHDLDIAYLKKDELEMVSHELRTPINAVVGYAALLEDRILGELSEKQERAIRRIMVAAQQLLSAVNQALLLAHIEVGDFEAGDFTTRRRSLAGHDARDSHQGTSANTG